MLSTAPPQLHHVQLHPMRKGGVTMNQKILLMRDSTCTHMMRDSTCLSSTHTSSTRSSPITRWVVFAFRVQAHVNVHRAPSVSRFLERIEQPT